MATLVPSHDITREFMPSLRETLSVIETLQGLSDASSTSSSHLGPSGHVLDTSFGFAHLPYELVLSFLYLLSCCVSVCILPSLLWKISDLFVGLSGTLSRHPVVRPCFHSWGWLMIQPLVFSLLTDFFLYRYHGSYFKASPPNSLL